MSPRRLPLATLVLAVGCGTTVPQATVLGRAASNPGLGVPAASAPPTGGAATTGATATAGTSAYQPTATGPGSASVAPGADQALGGVRPIAPTTPVHIGLMYSSDANSVAAAAGGALAQPDYRRVQGAVVSYINANGGLAGHRVVPEYYDAPQTETAQQISDEACASWVQDGHVLAAMPGLAVIDTSILSHCLNAAHVVTAYEGSYSTLDARTLAGVPYWFEPDTMSLEQLSRTYVQGLANLSFFSGARIGVIYDSYSQFTAVAKSTLIPAIQAAGGNVVSSYPQSIHGASDLGAGSSAMSSAVLQFRSANVNKVMFFDAWVGAYLQFTMAAEAQRWHPTYGLSSQDGPQGSLSSGLVPSGQEPGTVFAGWATVGDVRPEDSGNWARRTKCLSIYQHAGVVISQFSSDGYGAALSMCTGLLVLQDAARLVAGPLTPDALARAMVALGTSLQSATVPTTRFAVGRQYGVAGWRPGRYDASCNCFRYTGPTHSF